jgi:hypothetical protein
MELDGKHAFGAGVGEPVGLAVVEHEAHGSHPVE